MTTSPPSEFMETTRPGKRIMIVAGEASGDLHGASMARELLDLDGGLSLTGIGGKEMAAAGVDLLYNISRLAVMGIIEVISRLRDVRHAMRILENRFRLERPDLLILIDYPGFNLELARRAKKHNIPILYYISPKIWAWREGRIKSIKKYIDRMAVILPFEKEFYCGHGVDVDFVGNPLLDEVHVSLPAEAVRDRLGIGPGATVIGLMPGSRLQEIARLLPLFMQTALQLTREIKNCVFLLPLASTLSEEDLNRYGFPDASLDIRIIRENRYDAMAACDAALAASGTLTMELAILQVPMVVCYRVATLNYLLAKNFIKVKFASLVNLVAGEEVVPELLQNMATAENIYKAVKPLLVSAEARDAMQRKLADVCRQLGEPGASRRAAGIALDMLATGDKTG